LDVQGTFRAQVEKQPEALVLLGSVDEE
jgi:hypothetical protein